VVFLLVARHLIRGS